MYYVVKYNFINSNREVLSETIDAVKAFNLANIFDAKCKVGVEDEDIVDPESYIEIEDENGESKWHECSLAACPRIGIFH
jgi:hypothetical protein